MPSVPGVAGVPSSRTTHNKAEGGTLILPPAENDHQEAKDAEAIASAIPASPAPSIPPIPPTQDELALLSMKTQTVAKRNTMIPNSEPAYKFTDEDRDKALKSRWSSKYPWDTSDLDEALQYLAEIRAECEKGGIALQKRVSELRIERVKCFSCDNIIDISAGRWAGMRTRNNFETGVPESAYACSGACMLKVNREFTHPFHIRKPVGDTGE